MLLGVSWKIHVSSPVTLECKKNIFHQCDNVKGRSKLKPFSELCVCHPTYLAPSEHKSFYILKLSVTKECHTWKFQRQSIYRTPKVSFNLQGFNLEYTTRSTWPSEATHLRLWLLSSYTWVKRSLSFCHHSRMTLSLIMFSPNIQHIPWWIPSSLLPFPCRKQITLLTSHFLGELIEASMYNCMYVM